jgi:hypothetical protein
VVSDLRRTWIVNSVDLEFDLDREEVLGVEKRRLLECTLVPHDGALACGKKVNYVFVVEK